MHLTALSALFETADPKRDPEGLISKYLQFESFRLVRDGQIDDMVGTLQDRLEVLLWYVVEYGRHRQHSVALPLSRQQLVFLNSPAPLAGASPAVSIALLNFVHRELSPTHDLRNTGPLRDAVYWWCVDFAPMLKLEDRLVTKEQINLLRAEAQWQGQEFPMNYFMIMFFNKHTELHFLDLNITRDRAALYIYLIVFSFTSPHVLRLLVTEPVRRLLGKRDGYISVFEEALARFCVPDYDSNVAAERAQSLLRVGEALLSRHGISLKHFAPATSPTIDAATGHSGECFLPPTKPVGRLESGLAVIGPVSKASGLGQAMRISVDVLTVCEIVQPTVIDFDLDNPAPVGFASQTNYMPYRNQRTINLIHLNAESIPLAFAYQPHEVFARSYNIGFFFWELNEIPKCHRLALDMLDEIWVSSEYNREIYKHFTEKPVINVGMGVEDLPDVEPMDLSLIGLAKDTYVFLTTFDSFSFIERKNPLGVIEAFRRAFPSGVEPVRLVIKTQNRHRVHDPYQVRVWKRIDVMLAADPRILVINETFKYRDLLALKRACNCYVSLHRSEGWGFGMIEAMQLSLPVIATAYSGNMDFCNTDTTYLVEYRLTSVRPEEYIFCERNSHWADPNLDTAASCMRSVVADPTAAEAKGAAAARYIAEHFSVAAIAQRYASRLVDVRSFL